MEKLGKKGKKGKARSDSLRRKIRTRHSKKVIIQSIRFLSK